MNFDAKLEFIRRHVCAFMLNKIIMHLEIYNIIITVNSSMQKLFFNGHILKNRGVNLAQPIGFGPDPCGLGPKKSTLKKNP